MCHAIISHYQMEVICKYVVAEKAKEWYLEGESATVWLVADLGLLLVPYIGRLRHLMGKLSWLREHSRLIQKNLVSKAKNFF